MKKLIILLTLISTSAFAQNEPLKCAPKDVQDGGFTVEAHLEDESSGRFHVKISQLYGEGETSTKYDNKMLLKKFKNKYGKCVIQFVDSLEKSENIVSLVIGGEDFVQKLKGDNQAAEVEGQRINVLNKISCQGSSAFDKTIKDLCKS